MKKGLDFGQVFDEVYQIDERYPLRMETIAQRCFPHGSYSISGDDPIKSSSGRLEILINSDKEVTNSLRFINDFNRNLEICPEITYEMMVMNFFYHVKGQVRQIKFSFDPTRRSLLFSENEFVDFTAREYLDRNRFGFHLLKRGEGAYQFEYFPLADRVEIKGAIPKLVAGPDGVIDDLFQTKGMLENYVEFQERGILTTPHGLYPVEVRR